MISTRFEHLFRLLPSTSKYSNQRPPLESGFLPDVRRAPPAFHEDTPLTTAWRYPRCSLAPRDTHVLFGLWAVFYVLLHIFCSDGSLLAIQHSKFRRNSSILQLLKSRRVFDSIPHPTHLAFHQRCAMTSATHFRPAYLSARRPHAPRARNNALPISATTEAPFLPTGHSLVRIRWPRRSQLIRRLCR